MLLLLLIGVGLGYYGKNIQGTTREYHIESINLSYGSPNASFYVENGKDEIEYEPEVASYSGLEIQTKYYSFGIQFTDGASSSEPSDKAYKPTSKVSDFQFEGIYDRFIWTVYYQSYRNLYWTEQSQEDAKQYHLDLINYGFGIQYALNDKVNINEILGSTSKKKIQGSSWITGLQLNHSQAKSNHTIIPEKQASLYADINELTEVKTNYFGINFGWGGQLLYKSFFANIKLAYGLAYQEQTLINGDERIRHYPANQFHLTSDLGFIFNTSIFGLKITGERITSNLASADIATYRANSHLYYRYFF